MQTNTNYYTMKKIYVFLILAFLPTVWLGAQEPGESFAQPKSVIGRKINASGEITKQYEAAFSYAIDGKLDGFLFEDFGISSTYLYSDDFITDILTLHEGSEHIYDEALRYTYEDGRVKLESHTWSGMNSNEYITYTYYDDGRLKRKDYASYHPDDFNSCSQFEYKNEGKTRIESYSARAFQGYEIVLPIKYRITSQYDDDYRLISERKDHYNNDGELTKITRKLYSYSPSGKLETEISQTFALNFGALWENNSIHKYVYDDQDQLMEQQKGTWSKEQGDWMITKKTVHEYSSDNMTYTVSFYKNDGDGWVRDIFDTQKLFFKTELQRQQEAMSYFAYEDPLGSSLVNQFEFEMINTKTPTYNATMENEDALCSVYPNPGQSHITVTAPVENAVIRFYDLQGRQLLVKPFDFSTTVDAGDWTPGVYLWELWNGTNKIGFGKWIKQ